MKAVLSEKGQVTIPKQVRDSLGLRPGVSIDFHTENGRLIGIKSVKDDVFRKWRGRGKLPLGTNSVDEYIRSIRDEK